MGVKNIRWHMVLCVDDRGGGCGRFEEKEREKGCVFASVIFG